MDVDTIDLSALDIKDNERKRTFSEALPLDIDCDNIETKNEVRRSARKKIRPMQEETKPVVTRVRKLNQNSSRREIEQYYLDKKIRLSSTSLETIFEEPKNNTIMSTRKLRRLINFSELLGDKPDKNKVKKRSMKAKKIVKGGFKNISKKLSLDVLKSKLQELDKLDEVC